MTTAYTTQSRRTVAQVKARVQQQFAATVDADIDPDALAAYAQALGATVEAGQLIMGNLTSAQLAGELGIRAPTVDPVITQRENGISKADVYQRPYRVVEQQIRGGASIDEAVAAGSRRLGALTDVDLQMAKVRQAQQVLRVAKRKTYRRQTTSENPCPLCQIAATQVYYTDDLLPIHDRCYCEVVEDDTDGDQDEADQEDFEPPVGGDKTKTISELSEKGADPKDYRDLIAIREHGEIGPMLTWRDQKFTGPGDLPNTPVVLDRKGRILARHGHALSLEDVDARNAADRVSYRRRAAEKREVLGKPEPRYARDIEAATRKEAEALVKSTEVAARGAVSKPSHYTEESFEEHRQHVDAVLRNLFNVQLDSKADKFGFAIHGEWTSERRAQQKAIIDEILTGARDLPRNHEAIMAGGLGGSGKGTVLKKFAGVDQSRYLTLNPDDIKVVMADKGMIPVLPGLSPMEASPLVHEEASEITKELGAIVQSQGINVIWDQTMASSNSTLKRLAALEESGYQVDGVFVDIAPETAKTRAAQRYRRGQEAYLSGKGEGGRFLPSYASEAAEADPGSKYQSKNRETWEQVKDRFGSSVVYDNNAATTKLGSTGPRWADKTHVPEVISKPHQYTDESFEEHRQHVDVVLRKLFDTKLDSKADKFGFATHGEWTPERRAQQKVIIDEILDSARDLPHDHEAIMAGGLGGSGKGTVLKKFAGVDQSRYLTLNPDDIKVIMADKGMIPVLPGLSPMEASPLVHEEASEITKELGTIVQARGINVIWDQTMASSKSTLSRLAALEESGYQVDGVFVDIAPETAKARAAQRYRRGQEAYLSGKGEGGRFLPSYASEAAEADPGSKYQSKNRETWEQVKDRFGSSVVYDNNAATTKLGSTGPRWEDKK